MCRWEWGAMGRVAIRCARATSKQYPIIISQSVTTIIALRLCSLLLHLWDASACGPNRPGVCLPSHSTHNCASVFVCVPPIRFHRRCMRPHILTLIMSRPASLRCSTCVPAQLYMCHYDSYSPCLSVFIYTHIGRTGAPMFFVCLFSGRHFCACA
jgi:hypothetical protein